MSFFIKAIEQSYKIQDEEMVLMATSIWCATKYGHQDFKKFIKDVVNDKQNKDINKENADIKEIADSVKDILGR